MNEKYTYYLRYACISSALAAALALGGCSSGERGVATQNEAVAANAQDGQAAVSDGTDETIAPLGMDGQILPGLDDVELPEEYKIDLRHFCMPTPSTRITSNYGYRASFRRQHKGLDIKVYIGDTIRSAFSGKMRIVDYERRGYGNYIVIRHPNGLETIYGHLSKHLVKENQIVKAGEPIGLGGNTGRSTGSHLHFETRFLGQAINPAEMFDFVAQDVTGDYYIFRSNKGKSELAKNETNVRPKPTARPRSKVHRVKSGENLSVIASKCGTTVAKLCKLNGITRTTVLRPGQILKYS